MMDGADLTNYYHKPQHSISAMISVALERGYNKSGTRIADIVDEKRDIPASLTAGNKEGEQGAQPERRAAR